MARILPPGVPTFFMAPAGLPAGGSGSSGIPPGTKGVHTPSYVIPQSPNQPDISRLMGSVRAAISQAAEAADKLEMDLSAERARANVLDGRVAELTRESKDLRAETARLAEGKAAAERDLAKQLAANAKLDSSLARQRERLEEIVQQLSDAGTLSGQINESAERAAAIVAGAVAMLDKIAGLLEPLFGAASPVVNEIRQASESMAEAGASVGRTSSRLGELVDLLNSGEAHAAWLNPWVGRKDIPSLLERAKGDADAMSRGIFSSVFDSLSSIFDNMGVEAVTQRLNAFIEAAAFIMNQDGVEGSRSFVMKAISCLIDADALAHQRRGSFHEVVRAAGLMMSGRRLKQLSAAMPPVSFLGWKYSGDSFLADHLNAASEIDAVDDSGILLEFKAVNLAGPTGNYLAQMLKKGGDEAASVQRTRAEISTGRLDPGHLVKMANQLAKYREMIDAGRASSLELHLTSQTSIPRELVRAIHEFFGKDRVKILHYQDSLDSAAAALAPELEPEHHTASGPAPQASADPAPDRARGDEPARAVAQELRPKTREEVQATIYASTLFMTNAGHNANLVERFIDWMLNDSARAATFAAEPDESLQSHLLDQFILWQSQQGGDDRDDADAPWYNIKTDRAQKRFISLYAAVTGKDVRPDWSQRVTQGVQNTDVIRVLASIQDQQAVTEDTFTGIGGMISDFISYLKEAYKAESYFKFDVDGDDLVGIMLRYIWITEESG